MQPLSQVLAEVYAIFVPPLLAHVLLNSSSILFVQGRCHLSPNFLFRFLCVETVLENSGK